MVRAGLSCWLLDPGVAQAADAYFAARALRDMRDCLPAVVIERTASSISVQVGSVDAVFILCTVIFLEAAE
ncbi:hypothetical protein NDU88_004336 [Pleurodeles waltl]|uniref:Uncharacterized protein n=1 Tax=Pleurodeles waltl TaxID=8319 RepID=A0AAV7RJ13_PLEWA|nr:hypothetical protein NDU88_004336 [Pleurodeles waltl]